MKKYVVIEDYYKKEKSDVFKLQYTRDASYENEIFDTLEEARDFCKKNNVTTCNILDDEKAICHYYIEEREMDEGSETMYDALDYHTVTDNEENVALMYDSNTGRYEITDDIFGDDDRFKVAEQLFIKNLTRSNFYYQYVDWLLRVSTFDCQTFYFKHEKIMNTENPAAVVDKLKELGIYNDIIHDYLGGIKEVTFYARLEGTLLL